MIDRPKQDNPAEGDGAIPPAAQAGGESAAPSVQAELDELMDRLKRTTADYQNYQKRVAREMADARRYANAEFVKDLLVIVDDLERAMKVKPESPSAAVVFDGVRITHEHLTALLARHGVEVIDSPGRPFDPQLHEAMMQQPSGDVPPMTVLAEVRKGYRMHDRVLRPARVVVSSAPAEKA